MVDCEREPVKLTEFGVTNNAHNVQSSKPTDAKGASV